jgi:hypothetical protein
MASPRGHRACNPNRCFYLAGVTVLAPHALVHLPSRRASPGSAALDQHFRSQPSMRSTQIWRSLPFCSRLPFTGGQCPIHLSEHGNPGESSGPACRRNRSRPRCFQSGHCCPRGSQSPEQGALLNDVQQVNDPSQNPLWAKPDPGPVRLQLRRNLREGAAGGGLLTRCRVHKYSRGAQ